jgi:hypothetical protein
MGGMSLVRTAGVVCGAVAWSAVVSAQPVRVAPAQPVRVVPAVTKPGSVTVQGFSVVLLLGDLQGGTTADNVPPAARKALVDMKDFLPYKSYRLLDTAWTLASNNGVRSTMRLRGPENQEFELNLNGVAAPVAGAPARLNLSFGLSDGGSDTAALYSEASRIGRVNEQRRAVAELEARLVNFDRENERAEKQLEGVVDPDRRDALARRQEGRLALNKQLALARERLTAAQTEQQAIAARGQQQEADARKLQLEAETRKMQVVDLEARRKALDDNLQSLRSRYNSGHPQVVQLQAELDRLSAQLASVREGVRPSFAAGRRIIDASFSMDIGETVVVGTSRLGGEKAIIALLTAVRRGR